MPRVRVYGYRSDCNEVVELDGDPLVVRGCGFLVRLVGPELGKLLRSVFSGDGGFDGWLLHCVLGDGDLFLGSGSLMEFLSHYLEFYSVGSRVCGVVELPRGEAYSGGLVPSPEVCVGCCYLVLCDGVRCRVAVFSGENGGDGGGRGPRFTRLGDVWRVLTPCVPVLASPGSLRVCYRCGDGVRGVGWVLSPRGLRRVARYCPPRDPGHTVLFGGTGSGKSTCLRGLARYYAGAGWRCIVLDWVGEHACAGDRVVDASELRAPYLGGDVARVVELVDSMLLAVWGEQLTPMMTMLLYQALGRSRHLEDILSYLQSIAGSDRERLDIRQSAMALLNRLRPLRRGLQVGEPGGHPVDAYAHPGKVVVLDLSNLDPRSRVVVSHLVLAYLLARLQQSRRVETMVFVDEAHNVYPRLELPRPTLVELIPVEARKYGLRVVAASAAPTRVSRELVYNANTLYAFHQHGVEAREVALKLAAVEREVEEYSRLLAELPTGYAVASHGGYNVLIEVEAS